MIEIFALNVANDWTDYEYDQLLLLVSEHKREQVKGYRHRTQAICSICGEILARIAVKKIFGITDQEISYGYQTHGKPYLENLDGVYFNISHSKDWVVCAVGIHEVGIDIEQMKKDRMNLAKRFFTTKEYEQLSKQPEYEQIKCFYRLWTLKECYVKWKGDGLRIPLNSFTFQIDCEKGNPCLEEHQKLNFRQYELENDYMVSVCSEDGEFCREIRKVTLTELFHS